MPLAGLPVAHTYSHIQSSWQLGSDLGSQKLAQHSVEAEERVQSQTGIEKRERYAAQLILLVSVRLGPVGVAEVGEESSKNDVVEEMPSKGGPVSNCSAQARVLDLQVAGHELGLDIEQYLAVLKMQVCLVIWQAAQAEALVLVGSLVRPAFVAPNPLGEGEEKRSRNVAAVEMPLEGQGPSGLNWHALAMIAEVQAAAVH